MAKPVRPLVPPDGGWGWMVVFGVAVCNATTQSLLSVFGLLFGDTLEEMGVETTGAAIISNSMVAINNFSGLITGPVMRRFTYRQVAIAGGLLVALGMFITSLATRVWHFIISYSILVGLGLGLLNPSTFVAVNAFFTHARGRAVGLSMAGTGLGQMLMPIAVRFLLDEYSFRGAVLVLSAVALHSLAGAALFHPLRWHARPAPLSTADATERVPLARQRPGTKARTNRGDAETPTDRQPLTGGAAAEKTPHPPLASAPLPMRDVAAMGENLPVVSALGSEPVGVGREKALAAQGEKDPTAAEKPTLCGGSGAGCWARWVRLLDLDLLSDPGMVMLLTGLAAVYTAGVNFNMLYPFFLSHAGFPRADVALCMSVMAGFDISSRLVLPAFTDRLRVPARLTYLVGALVLAACRSLVALQHQLPGLLASSALCGFVRGATTVNHNLAVSESCTPEKLPGALGLNMVIKGISILLIGLFIGWLRDLTGSFTLCMHVLSLIITLPMLAWLVEIWLQRRRRRRGHHHQPPSPSPSSTPSPSPHNSPPPYEAPPSPPPSPSPASSPATTPMPTSKMMATPRLQGQR